MTNEKRPKPKIKRRPPGLVITPPTPRPVGEDHPARLLFREAIESAKPATAADEAADAAVAAEPVTPVEEAAPASLPQAQPEALQIFKELREAAAGEESAGTAVEEDESPRREEIPPREEAQEETPSPDAGNFDMHFGQWKPFLSEAQMCLLEALYNMTHAKGVAECLTSMPKLAEAAGISERQTYNVVKELERTGFIERPETFNTPMKKGTIFRLLLTRRTTPGPERRYHFGD
ncbi:MAG: helix-turn-helix domain-containing protein [Acidobacteriota bacterium]|nr:helix-turn-helix domain-containing protein [Acidobacteriota bacterium]